MGNTGNASFGHAAFQGIAAYAVAILVIRLALKHTLIFERAVGPGFGRRARYPPSSLRSRSPASSPMWRDWRSAGWAAWPRKSPRSPPGDRPCHLHQLGGPLPRPRAFYGVPVISNLYWGLGASIIALVTAKPSGDSSYGVQLRAASDNLLAARAMGVPVERLRLMAWTLSGLVMGMAGILLATYVGTIRLELLFQPDVSGDGDAAAGRHAQRERRPLRYAGGIHRFRDDAHARKRS